ncbi:C2 family cysteine protease [Anabaena subtropica]|uniref:Pre-peptidase C-terminal domain-containing protein n=1 Tax=Anabaena subtropica FACHB-260 TaxID=2692884 RepID=A0ABR8CUR4_9NOST|nr:C2 family cysteine protease [Anabaena subtropica]MBD2346511.1 pre-peptidase C-terminal domain-containing protein [Anabaena subtropica FACHB-260]
MSLDKAGNTLNTARSLNITSNIQTFSDWVGSSDFNDVYSFNLTARSSINIAVDGLSANADLQLIRDKNSNGLIDYGDVIASSSKSGTLSESINKALDAGNYFIRVYAKSGDTNYDLKVFQNFAPSALNFQLNNTDLNTTDTISINSGWVSDGNSVSDLSRVDFRIIKPDGKYLDVADAITFTADISNPNKAYFGYSLSLTDLNLEAGKYTLEGKAYDKTGAGSNTVKRTFTLTNTLAAQDWFSQNLLDQEIITLARTLASDGNLNRQDMLDIFRNAQDNSVINANEVKDLRALVAASTPFSMDEPVKWLSTQVANGASVDMSASNFESSLVGRWFLGTIAPTPVFNGKNLTYTVVTGNLFGSANEARIGDIDQGVLGDCAFLAALGATFGRQSNDVGNASSSVINSMITDNGDNTYTMRFYSNGEAEYVTVDRRIATSVAAKRNNGILWVALVEKAYAQWLEWKENTPGYNRIGNGDSLSRPMRFITGQQTFTMLPTNMNIFSMLDSSLASGQSITAARVGADTKYIVSSHAYSVTNAYTSTSGEQRVVVRNPWGVDGKTMSGVNDGFIDLSYTEFSQTFNYGVSFAYSA